MDRLLETVFKILLLLVLALIAIRLTGCAGTSQETYWRTRATFVESQNAYNRFVAFDDANILRCYAAHPDLHGDAARAACPPAVSAEERQLAVKIGRETLVDFETIEPLVENGDATSAQKVAEVLGAIEARALTLLLLYGQE